jgi:hypothetical protein
MIPFMIIPIIFAVLPPARDAIFTIMDIIVIISVIIQAHPAPLRRPHATTRLAIPSIMEPMPPARKTRLKTPRAVKPIPLIIKKIPLIIISIAMIVIPIGLFFSNWFLFIRKQTCLKVFSWAYVGE